MLKKLLYILCLSSLCLATAHAEPEVDPEKLRQAAVAGNAEAQLELGMLYEYGFFMKENRVPALTWYMVAAQRGHARAVKQRDRLMAKMNQREIEEAERQAAVLGQNTQTSEPIPATTPTSPNAEQPSATPEESTPAEPAQAAPR